MGHCYSLDLRVRVVDFVEAGHSCRAAAHAGHRLTGAGPPAPSTGTR
ncbi:IS630 transposase-related protein [Microvirga terrestris]|nr:IS630 transposase-related protein [Microvirga terrestris]